MNVNLFRKGVLADIIKVRLLKKLLWIILGEQEERGPNLMVGICLRETQGRRDNKEKVR